MMALRWQVLHKWLALLIGLQLLLWIVSGLALNLIPSEVFNTELHRNQAKPVALGINQPPMMSLATLAAKLPNQHLLSVELIQVHGKPMYKLLLKDKLQLTPPQTAYYWAMGSTADFNPVSWDLKMLAELARSSYQPWPLQSSRLQQDSEPQQNSEPLETIAQPHIAKLHFSAPQLLQHGEGGFQTQDPVYLVTVNDEAQTRIYLNGASGEVLAHKNSRSNIKEWLFMLHFMDYAPDNGLSFNHLWTQIVALLSLLLGISGAALLIKRLYQGHFSLKSYFQQGFKPSCIQVFGKHDEPLSRLSLQPGMLLTSLNHPKERIATQCGGGGSCGLCMVRFMGTAPIAQEADLAKISRRKLDKGYRLSCQHDAADCQALIPERTELNIALATLGQLSTWSD
ncbi:PepSY domain-containing protein [Shewanella sp. SR44-3]|uniref:PepSY domain-containing protein n=1 Tax=Shewanella sp. SR44-3 TaxID=2760936 RepID=UPI0015FAABD4|nr:PepSY domain-containing protein [Shewanella sp. SR44-3]MBB1270260.1 PepSY domain-containing protein [Shewanella sp. SR44-3]